eukprot:6213813-Pleurochrysis_carterae.AAC.2
MRPHYRVVARVWPGFLHLLLTRALRVRTPTPREFDPGGMWFQRSLSLPIDQAATTLRSRMILKLLRRLGEKSQPGNELTDPPCSGVSLAAPRSLGTAHAWAGLA